MVGVVFLAVAVILCFRRRSRGRKESSQSPRGIRADKNIKNRMLPGLGVLGAVVEADGQQHRSHELHGYPIAVDHRIPLRELEARGYPPTIEQPLQDIEWI